MPELTGINKDKSTGIIIPELRTTRLTRELSLRLPPINSLLPLKKRQIEAMRVVDQTTPSPDRFRQKFQEAQGIIVNCHTLAMGDSITQARYAFAMARKRSDKSFTVQLPKAVTEISYFVSLPNVIIINNITKNHLDGVGNFFIAFDDNVFDSTRMENQLGEDYISTMSKITQLDEQNRIFEPSKSVVSLRFFLDSLGLGPDSVDFNIKDLKYAVMVSELGVQLSENDLKVSFLYFDNSVLQKNPQILDMIIVPDAKEFETPDKYRSLKSMPPEQWRDIFMSLPKSMSIGLIMGHTHKQYTADVLKAALGTGIKATEINTSTLDDFCRAVLSGKKFVGMDSGTTHLASEIAVAARKQGRFIDIKDIFNNNEAELSEWGIRGEETSILECPRIPSDPVGLEDVPLNELVSFILK